MIRGSILVAGALVGMVGLAACSSSTTRMSSKALCENAGGKYSQGVCQPGSARKAEEMCVGYGGLYVVDEDVCHVPIK